MGVHNRSSQSPIINTCQKQLLFFSNAVTFAHKHSFDILMYQSADEIRLVYATCLVSSPTVTYVIDVLTHDVNLHLTFYMRCLHLHKYTYTLSIYANLIRKCLYGLSAIADIIMRLICIYISFCDSFRTIQVSRFICVRITVVLSITYNVYIYLNIFNKKA